MNKMIVTSPFSSMNTSAANGTILTFDLDGQLYGLPLTAVAQIIEIVAITHLPQMPQGFQGAINVHGQIVPVIDLRRRFGLDCPPYHLHTPLVLIWANGRMLALIVDHVDDVATALPAHHNQLPDITAPISCLTNIVQLGNQLIPVLDPNRLLSVEEQDQLARLLPLPHHNKSQNVMQLHEETVG